MIEYKFLNKYNFWPVPHKYYAPFNLKSMIANKNGDIIDIVLGPVDESLMVEKHENRSEVWQSNGSKDNTK